MGRRLRTEEYTQKVLEKPARWIEGKRVQIEESLGQPVHLPNRYYGIEKEAPYWFRKRNAKSQTVSLSK